MACQSLSHFSTLSQKRQDFQKKVVEGKMCVSIFSTTLSEIFIIIRRIQRNIIVNMHGAASCEVLPVIIV